MKSITTQQNPSPSNDPYFDKPANLAEIKKRVKAHKQGKTGAVTLKTSEEIVRFIESL